MTTTSTPISLFSAPLDDQALTARMFGDFEGVRAPSSRLDALLAAHVKKEHFDGLAMAYGSRWWDYRRLGPGHSFMLFTREYYRAFQNACRNYIRHARMRQDPRINYAALHGPSIRVMNERDIWERDRRYITGMWKAMLCADLFGVPYDHFCRLTFLTAFDAKWTRIPSPWQMYSPTLCAQVLDNWEKTQCQRFIPAKHPMFSVENYAGLPIQDQYRDWLVEQIRGRVGDPAMPLSIAVYDNPQLPVEVAETHFDEGTMRRARSLAA